MWLKKAFGQAIDGGLIRKSTFTDENAIAAFGVGKNMVASIRHWALACGVMREAKDGFRVSSLASEILEEGGLDPYAGEPIDGVVSSLAAGWTLSSFNHMALAIQPCDGPNLHPPRA